MLQSFAITEKDELIWPENNFMRSESGATEKPYLSLNNNVSSHLLHPSDQQERERSRIVELEFYCDLTVTFVKDFSSIPPRVSRYR